MKEYVKDGVSKGELAVYRALGADNLIVLVNKSSSILVLPQIAEIDETGDALTLPYYEGETFNDVWTTENGGSPMDLRLAQDMPRVLKDLSGIDTAAIADNEALSGIPNLVFEHQAAVSYFDDIALGFRNEGLISDEAYEKIQALLEVEQTTDMIVNNGDFYPRNLIRRPDGKIVLIDWEVWNDHSPFYIIDHPENVAAVAYAHMWGNPEWQEAFRHELSKQFEFDPRSFDKGVAMKALTLAHFFSKHENLFQGQISILEAI